MTAYYWISFIPFVLMCAYIIYKYVLAIQNRPRIQKAEILYQEWFASGCSMKNILTRFGGARNCLRLVVTKDLLWVTSWIPFSIFAVIYDMEHIILLDRITKVELKRDSLWRGIRLMYADTNGAVHSLHLVPKDEEGLLRAIGDNRREKPEESFKMTSR